MHYHGLHQAQFLFCSLGFFSLVPVSSSSSSLSVCLLCLGCSCTRQIFVCMHILIHTGELWYISCDFYFIHLANIFLDLSKLLCTCLFFSTDAHTTGWAATCLTSTSLVVGACLVAISCQQQQKTLCWAFFSCGSTEHFLGIYTQKQNFWVLYSRGKLVGTKYCQTALQKGCTNTHRQRHMNGPLSLCTPGRTQCSHFCQSDRSGAIPHHFSFILKIKVNLSKLKKVKSQHFVTQKSRKNSVLVFSWPVINWMQIEAQSCALSDVTLSFMSWNGDSCLQQRPCVLVWVLPEAGCEAKI